MIDISGVVLLIGGCLILISWFKEKKYPDQKKVGLFCVFMGVTMITARLFGRL